MTDSVVSDGGYTLAEALAAMLIIGLAMGAVFQGAQLLEKQQRRTTATVQDVRARIQAERALTKLIEESAGTNASVEGDTRRLKFDCAAGSCVAALSDGETNATLDIVRGKAAQSYVLPVRGPVKLVYEGADGRYDSWPPSDRQVALRGVSVVGAAGGERPLIVARPWIEQPTHCEFDTIARACRPSARDQTISTP